MRAADLRFELDETRELLAAAGIALSDDAVASLLSRTEGWAAGLRLAALSLAGRADPERFVAEFSGSERTVADYLFAEVLERQPEPVRQLLLRTSILERVNGALADRVVGDDRIGADPARARGRERIRLLDRPGAVVVPLPPAVRGSPAPGAPAHRARFRPKAAPRRGRVVRRARFRDRRDQACAGRDGLAVRRGSDRAIRLQPRARRQLRNDDGRSSRRSRRTRSPIPSWPRSSRMAR